MNKTMKAINKFFGIALMALGVLSVASCADENDWGVDSAFDRLFGVGEDALSVETTESTATVTFSALKATSDTIYFVIEVSKDSLYDEVEMGGSNAKVYGTNKEIKSSPYEITGLESDTKYYLRIKASSDTKADSKWVYYNNGGTFKTKAEQIFNAVQPANVGEDHVKLTWIPGAEVTLLTVATADGTVVKEIDLTQYPDAIEKGEYDVTGLTASTSYTFVIYNGETKRGTLNVTTAAAMPAGDYKVQLDESITQITQDVMDKFVADAQAATGKTDVSITIGIAGGKTVTVADVDDKGENASLAVPDGISVTFFGLAGEVPTLSFPKSLEIGGEHAYVRFENLILKDDGCQYIFNQSKACNVGEISFNGIKIDGLERSLVRLQSSDAKTVGTIIINDCQINNQGSGGYAMLLFKDSSENVGRVEISNSTFTKILNTFIQSSGSSTDTEMTIDACTFYDVIGSGKYLIDANKSGSNISISNTVFAKTNTDSSKGIRTDGEISTSQVYFTSDFKLSSNAFDPDMPNTPVASEDLFEDVENGDFTITDKELSVLGDPRWFAVEE